MKLGPRIAVVGTSGAGKTTLSARLAARLGYPHVELDAFQHGPNWQQATVEELRERTDAATGGDCWVCDGNYEAVRDLVWGRRRPAGVAGLRASVDHGARDPPLGVARHHAQADVEREPRGLADLG